MSSAMATRKSRSPMSHNAFTSFRRLRFNIQADRMVDIADVPFSQVSDEEKQVYAGTMKKTGSYQGYKLRNYWVCYWNLIKLRLTDWSLNSTLMAGSVISSKITIVCDIENYAAFANYDVGTVNRDVTKKLHPAALRPLLPEIFEFARFNHFHVLHEVLRSVFYHKLPQ